MHSQRGWSKAPRIGPGESRSQNEGRRRKAAGRCPITLPANWAAYVDEVTRGAVRWRKSTVTAPSQIQRRKSLEMNPMAESGIRPLRGLAPLLPLHY